MNKNDVVSVIVLTYNSEETIIYTLESILEQTFLNLELVVTDDCSKDNTVTIVKDWLKKHKSRFYNVELVFSFVNTGVPANCNRGLKKCTSKYVKFIAGDDLLMKTAIETYYDIALQNENNKMIFQSQLKLFGNTNKSVYQYIHESKKFFSLKNPKIQYDMLLKRNYISAPAIGLLNKELLLQINGFDERFHLCEDYPLWIKLSQQGYLFVKIEKVLVNYRINSISLSSNKIVFYEGFTKKYYKLVRRKLLIQNKNYLEVMKQDILNLRSLH